MKETQQGKTNGNSMTEGAFSHSGHEVAPKGGRLQLQLGLVQFRADCLQLQESVRSEGRTQGWLCALSPPAATLAHGSPDPGGAGTQGRPELHGAGPLS